MSDSGGGAIIGGAVICCCFWIFIFFLVGGASPDNTSSSTDIIVNESLEEESLPILNMTNVTLNASKVTFVYYDHNTSDWNGCYGLNYTVLTDEDNNSYMLDHATTDILGEKTNYTFTYPDGVGLVFDNNTQTDIYNRSGLYYVHELRDDNNNVVKSLGNFTLYDKSHQPQLIPGDWLFVYSDHNSTTYEGDEGLQKAVTHNISGNNTEINFVDVKDIIGLAYFADKDFDFYKYGLSGLEVYKFNSSDGKEYFDIYAKGLCLPNGTHIKTFDIESYGLIQKQKDFITNYYNRIDEVRHQQEIDAIYDAEDAAYDDYVRYQESQNNKAKYSTYYGTNGYGVIRSY